MANLKARSQRARATPRTAYIAQCYMVTPLTVRDFDFATLRLGTPTLLPGGAYFIRFSVSGAAVYIQTPVCKTKQGIVKTGKKTFCDMCVRQDDEDFVAWTEGLEQHARETIFAHRDEWFQTSLDMHDIENYFSPVMKFAKAARAYTLRANVPATLKIYNEAREAVSQDDVAAAPTVAAVVEVKGIRCSARSFAVETEIKQMMVMDDSDPFDQCVINVRPAGAGTAAWTAATPKVKAAPALPPALPPALAPAPMVPVDIDIEPVADDWPDVADADAQYKDPEDDEDEGDDEADDDEADRPHLDGADGPLEDAVIDVDDIVEILVDAAAPVVHLNRRGDIHREMYRAARAKAKAALEAAIAAYDEAAHVRQLYLLTAADEADEIGPLPDHPPGAR